MIHQLGLSRGESKDCVFGIFLVSFLPLQGLFCVCVCVCVCVCMCPGCVHVCFCPHMFCDFEFCDFEFSHFQGVTLASTA